MTMHQVQRRRFLVAAGALLAAPTLAQQQGRIPSIGYLSVRFGGESRDEAFRQGLRALGYQEGKNIRVEYRYARDEQARVRELAIELARLKVDVIVTGGSIATRAAKAATADIPIVMAAEIDPVGSGFVASLAHPGGNITGMATLAPERVAKQLELLKEAAPRLSLVAVLGNSNQPGTGDLLRAAERAAKTLGMKVLMIDVLTPADVESAFRAIAKERADAILIPVSGGIFLTHRKQILEWAAKSRLPAMYTGDEYVLDGGLMTYSPSNEDLFRRAAAYVDKILKGAKPADLPVEQPTKFELLINLRTAKALGLTVPPSLRLRADRLIE